MRKTTAEKAAQKIEIADRRRKVAALALARVPQKEIARQLQTSPATICLDLAALRAEWRADRGPDVAAMQDQDVAALSADEMRWRQKWATVTETDLQLRIYDRILRISERRAKLLGLDAPTKAEVSGKDGGPVEVRQTVDLAALSDAELDGLIAQLQDRMPHARHSAP